MSFAVQFGPNAERDFLRAQAYYDQVAPHQTDRFIASVFAASRVLADHPEIGRPLREDARRWHAVITSDAFRAKVGRRPIQGGHRGCQPGEHKH